MDVRILLAALLIFSLSGCADTTNPLTSVEDEAMAEPVVAWPGQEIRSAWHLTASVGTPLLSVNPGAVLGMDDAIAATFAQPTDGRLEIYVTGESLGSADFLVIVRDQEGTELVRSHESLPITVTVEDAPMGDYRLILFAELVAVEAAGDVTVLTT